MKTDRLQELEVKVAFLEDALSKLSDAHYHQQMDINILKNKYTLLLGRVNHQNNNDDTSVSVDIEKPPHY